MIWCVEDDPAILQIELYALQAAGFEVRGFESGSAFYEAVQTETPRLVILDVMLPGMDGVTLLKRLKAHPQLNRIPVIMATALGTEYDKIQTLELGAEDHLVKPFGVRELVSRVKAVLRRCEKPADAGILRLADLALDAAAHSVTLEGQPLALTQKEFWLLRLFLSNPGVVFTRQQLFAQVWGEAYTGQTRTVDTHILTLRKKLETYGSCIETVRPIGYRLSPPEV